MLRDALQGRGREVGTFTMIVRRLGTVVAAAGLVLGTVVGFGVSPASAVVCDPASPPELCAPDPVSAVTPLGAVTATVDPSSGAVTVHLEATDPNTFVFGLPIGWQPPGPPTRPAFARTTLDTAGGQVTLDTFKSPNPNRFGLPAIAVISLQPPGPPVRVQVATSGTTVVLTPIRPPGPPS